MKTAGEVHRHYYKAVQITMAYPERFYPNFCKEPDQNAKGKVEVSLEQITITETSIPKGTKKG